MMYMVAPAAIGVFILTVIILIAICFKAKKKTRASNEISVSYPRTNAASNSCTVRYMTNADVVTFEPENESIDNEIIYDYPETYHQSTDEISMQQKSVKLRNPPYPFVQPKM